VAPAAALTPDLVANGGGTANVNSQMLYRTAYIGVDLNVSAWAVCGSPSAPSEPACCLWDWLPRVVL